MVCRRRGLVGLAAVGSVALVGCTSAVTPLPPQSEQSQSAPTSSAGIDWQPCQGAQVTLPLLTEPADLDNYQCAVVAAPMNWDEPEGPTIELALARYVAAGTDAPFLFFNLGGPGGDAVQSLSSFVGDMLPEEVSQHHQVVAVDPRGVGESTPVRCRTDAELDEELGGNDQEDWQDLSAEEMVAKIREEAVSFAEQCYERNGDIIKFVDTFSVAQDFDLVRELVGSETFDYVGYSYGTAVGAVYAEKFPDRVGRMVLDGALDPGVTASELTALQAEGMENALYHWIEWCHQQSACPLTGDVEAGKKQIRDFLDNTSETPLPSSMSQRKLTGSLAQTGIIGSLYSEDSYPLLQQGMTTALDGDGTILMLLADFYNGRNNDGTYSNSQDVFTVINSLEVPPDGTIADWEKQATDLAERLPVFGDSFGFGSAAAEAWPYEPRRERTAVDVTTAAPILIIGTTNDPATPYAMAESLSQSIAGSVLITLEGFGHGAYTATGSACIQDLVTPYLLEGKIPDPVTCSQ